LKEKREWTYFDAVDPCSGNPVFGSRGSSVYDEVDGVSRVMGLPVESVGFCKVVVHPIWKTAIYPASMFIVGERSDIESSLSEFFSR
jgi:hypothetical protein